MGLTSPVNPPVVRASTALYRDVETMREVRRRSDEGEAIFRYGSRGTPTTFALEDAITEIERGKKTMLFCTGLAAIAHIFLSALRPGDHMLLGETVYGPARALATEFLPERGIDCEFYVGGHEEAAARMRPETKMIYIDNPGSIVYDIQDVPALAKLCEGRDTLLAVDNTWGAAGLYRPIELGADISVIAVTKYIAGHSDIMMGSVTANARTADALYHDACLMGQTVSPDEAYAALRGLRSVAARLAMHQVHAAEVITWMQKQPQIKRVLYPALETDPGHALFKRDFSGANGLLSIEFADGITLEQANKFADALELFGLGASWGGYESLVMVYPKIAGWDGGALARLHIGLEDPADLIADLGQALEKAVVDAVPSGGFRNATAQISFDDNHHRRFPSIGHSQRRRSYHRQEGWQRDRDRPGRQGHGFQAGPANLPRRLGQDGRLEGPHDATRGHPAGRPGKGPYSQGLRDGGLRHPGPGRDPLRQGPRQERHQRRGRLPVHSGRPAAPAAQLEHDRTGHRHRRPHRPERTGKRGVV